MNNANKIAKLTAELETQQDICSELFHIFVNTPVGKEREHPKYLFFQANTVRSDIKAELRRLKA